MNKGTHSRQELHPRLYDEFKPLYLALFKKEMGRIELRDSGEQDLALSGEILIAAQPSQDNTLIVEEIRYVSLWSDPLDALRGIISLVGPTNEIQLEPGPDGVVEPFDMRLYYSLLSDLKPAYVESDAVYSELETFRGQLIWEREDPVDTKVLRARVTVDLKELIDPRIGAVRMVTLGPTVMSFQLVEGGAITDAQANSLSACTTSAPLGAGNTVRELGVRFVSLVDPVPSAYENIAQKQIDGACEVWHAKGGLKIVPGRLTPTAPNTPDIDPPAKLLQPFPSDGVIAADQEERVPCYAGDDQTRVDVYLAERLTGGFADGLPVTRTGGGVAYCQGDDSYIILDIQKAEHNRYLLAHEIGHVLGLQHPDGTGSGFVPGSYCSVMVPDRPNSSRNTATNLGQISNNSNPLGQAITSLSVDCGLAPDADPTLFHIIRDLPYDDGTEPSVLKESFADHWSHSDVWNSDKPPWVGDPHNQYATSDPLNGTPMFDSNHSPFHSPPQSFTPANAGLNYLYVRLHTCQRLVIQDPVTLEDTLIDPVKVHLYRTDPGASSTPLDVIPPKTGTTPTTTNPLDFTIARGSNPRPGDPKVEYMNWDLTGNASHCSIFAVAEAENANLRKLRTLPPPTTRPQGPAKLGDIIDHPSWYTYSDLFGFLQLDNDVALRAYNLQTTTPTSGALPSSMSSSSDVSRSDASFSTTLAWVETSNPLEEPAPASVEVDTTRAANLQRLTLEVDDKVVGDVAIGQLTRIGLADALQPKSSLILRLRATLPPHAPEGATFPIGLRFFANDKLIGAYTHELRVAPLSATVLQSLDTLYGALRDVSVGCQAKHAQYLAERVKGILLRERAATGQPRGCLGLIRMIFRRKRTAWRSEVSNLAGDVAALAQSLEAIGNEPERQAVRRRLYELAGHLLVPADTPSPIYIEQIRDLADRIQARAGRLARRVQLAQR